MHTTSGGRVAWQSTSNGENSYSHWAARRSHGRAPRARSRQSKIARVGYLRAASPNEKQFNAFRDGLRALGYVEGRNIVIEQRYAAGALDRLGGLAADLVRLNMDVIAVDGSTTAKAAKAATAAIPVVFLHTQTIRPLDRTCMRWKRWAVTLGLTVRKFEARSVDDLPRAFAVMVEWQANGVITLNDAFLFSLRHRIVMLALNNKLAAVHPEAEFVEAGGLLSYGASLPDLFRRAASYVDKILKGANPAELPIEQPSKFELVVNLKAAQTLGLTISREFLLRADEMIE